MDKKVLDAQRPGSDLHGLIEKIAFLVWMNIGLPQDENWKSAKNILLESGYSVQIDTPEQYHQTLEWTADGIRRNTNADQDSSWYQAQEHWARQIFNVYNGKRTQN